MQKAPKLVIADWKVGVERHVQLVSMVQKHQFAHFSIAVNVPVSVQFKLPNFVEELIDILDTSGANPRLLKLEPDRKFGRGRC